MPRRKTWVIAGVTAGAVVLLGGGATFAQTAEVFVAPKQIFINALNKAPIGKDSTTAEKSSQGTLNLKLNNFTAGSDPSIQEAINMLNGSEFDINYAIDPQNQRAQAKLTFKNTSGSYSGQVWANSDDVILGLSSLQPLINQLMTSMGSLNAPVLPEYLDDGGTDAGKIQTFWAALNQQHKTFTPEQVQAIKQIATMFVQSIPSKDIARTGLTSFQIQLDQKGLETITDSFINDVYQNQSKFVDAVNALEAGNPNATPLQVSDFSTTSASEMIDNVNKVLNMGIVNIDTTTLAVQSSSIFDHQATYKLDTKITLHPTQADNNVGFNLVVSESGTTPVTSSITIPTLNSSNSKTFEQFAQESVGPQ